MKRFALLPALFALLLAAVLTGTAFAQQAPPGPTSPQAGDMIPDAITIAAFAARSATAGTTAQAEYLLPDVTFAARSATAGTTAQAEYLLPDVTFVAGSQTAHYDDSIEAPQVAAAMRAVAAAQSAQTAQVAPSHFDDSIEAPQVAAAMRAMAATHVPSMEAIRLAQASTKAAAEEKSQQARLQDPTLATPAQSAQTAQLAPSHDDEKAAAMRDMVQAIRAARGVQTAKLAPSHDDEKAAAMRDMVQALRTTQGSQNPQLATSHYTALGAVTSAQATLLGLPALARVKATTEAKAQGSQSARLTSSHYAALGALTSAQARALGLPALAGIKEMAEERYLAAIFQNPALLALVQAEEASQHVVQTVGELTRLARAESEHEATESPIEAAFEAAEAAHNPGVSLLQVLP
jgi:hypothetical protein